MAQPQNESNAFTFDEEEDMDFLLEQAANAGSAAVDEQHEGNGFDDDLFKFDGEAPAATKPVAAAPVREPEREPEPVYQEETFEEPTFEAPQEKFSNSLDDFDLDAEFNEPQAEVKEETRISDVQRDLEALRAETAALSPEPAKPTRTPPKADPKVDSIRDLESRRSEEPRPRQRIEVPTERAATPSPTPSASNRIIRQTEEEQIAHATAILAAADVYRKLKSQERAVVAQLITQDAEFADDAASIAIRAINTDELTFATIEALKKAKEEEPVDRAFYILALDDEVRVSLGALCTAFTGNTLSTSDTLAFSRELVREVEKLDAEAIGFVSSTEAVLRAAKQR